MYLLITYFISKTLIIICLPVSDQMELDNGLQRGLQLWEIDELQSRMFV